MLKRLILVLGLAASFGVLAAGQQSPQQGTQSVTSGSTTLIKQGSYINSTGNTVHRPAHTVSGDIPPGASAQCRDGSYSFSQHHSGTCSHHGGVARWL
jgi:hypothetical protein